MDGSRQIWDEEISIHALREEGDCFWRHRFASMTHFYPRPPRGGRPVAKMSSALNSSFLSTPSARRATVVERVLYERVVISIHALREEGDLLALTLNDFDFEFLSTPSARRATQRRRHPGRDFAISIHALREEGDAVVAAVRAGLEGISIHALREEGDDDAEPVVVLNFDFYPRPPRGGRRRYSDCQRSRTRISIHALREEGDYVPLHLQGEARGISIHALREEGDTAKAGKKTTVINFYPRPPRGGRLQDGAQHALDNPFLSTPSARRAT